MLQHEEVYHVKENGTFILQLTIFFEGHTSLFLYVSYTLTMSYRTLISRNGDLWILSFGSEDANTAHRFTLHFDRTGAPDTSLDTVLQRLETLGEEGIQRQITANDFCFNLVFHWNEGGPNDQQYQNALRYCRGFQGFLLGLRPAMEAVRARQLGNDVGGNGNENLGECFGDPNDPSSLPYAGRYDLWHRDGVPNDLWKLRPDLATPDKFVLRFRDYDGSIVTFQGGFPTWVQEEWNDLTPVQCETIVAANPAVRPLLLPRGGMEQVPYSAFKAACDDEAITFAYYRPNAALGPGETNIFPEAYDELSGLAPVGNSGEA